MNKRLNYIDRAKNSESDISSFYPFFLSTKHLLDHVEIPLMMAERIIEISEELRQWKIKTEVLNTMSKSEINENELWDTLRIGLENGSAKLIKKCLRNISKITNYQLDIKLNDFKRLDIYIYPMEISLVKIHSQYLNNLFRYFEKYGKVHRKSHSIELLVRMDTDPLFLVEFMKEYDENIKQMEFICFDYLDEKFIDEHLSRKANLSSLRVTMGKMFSADCLLLLRKLPSLEKLIIEGSYIEMFDFSYLKSLKEIKICDLISSQKIEIKKCPKLERIHVVNCPELITLNVSDLDELHEIEISNCGSLNTFKSEHLDKLSDFRILKCPDLSSENAA